jgi:RNA-binding protein
VPTKRSVKKPAPKKGGTKKAPAKTALATKPGARAKKGPPPKKSPRKSAKLVIDGQQRSYLRGLGHHKDPVVMIGHKGFSKEVLKELDHALVAHELLKVKLLKSSPLSVAEAAAAMSDETGAFVAQTIGKIVLLYRPSPDPEKQKIVLPTRKSSDVETDESPTEDLERDEE